MCNCKDLVIESVAKRMEVETRRVSHLNFPLFGPDKPFIEVEVAKAWKTKKGVDKITKTKVDLYGNFCMFCGAKYAE